ncbi:MAG: hypothetical protein ACRDNP_16400, partial [Gaiellaceae bacterium]
MAVPFTIVKVCPPLVPPPPEFVTVAVRDPNVAAPSIVMLAVICVAEFTVVVLTVIPVPLNATELTPLAKLVPVKITFSVWKRSPEVGERAVSVGSAGAVTVKAPTDVPAAAPLFVTVMSRAVA